MEFSRAQRACAPGEIALRHVCASLVRAVPLISYGDHSFRRSIFTSIAFMSYRVRSVCRHCTISARSPREIPLHFAAESSVAASSALRVIVDLFSSVGRRERGFGGRNRRGGWSCYRPLGKHHTLCLNGGNERKSRRKRVSH